MLYYIAITILHECGYSLLKNFHICQYVAAHASWGFFFQYLRQLWMYEQMWVFTYSKLTIETLEQGVKYIQS